MKHYFQDIVNIKQNEMSNRAIAEALGLPRNTINYSISLMELLGMTYLDVGNLAISEIFKY